MRPFLSAILAVSLLACSGQREVESGTDWMIGPFIKIDDSNPVLTPRGDTYFSCPIRKTEVAWELKDVFNPAAIIKNDTIFMLYRAEDTVGVFNGTSRIGLAWSLEGVHFTRAQLPVFYPAEDEMKIYEWEGGIEDPRVVRTQDGSYVMTYTSYDGKVARLCVASSEDLRTWEKLGLAFKDPAFHDLWSKSGSIVTEFIDGVQTALKIDGRYWMYWGDTDLFLAYSSDLKDWNPITDEVGQPVPVMSPRDKMFDSRLVEPGPPAFVTDKGIVLVYNGMNLDEGGDPDLAPGTYSAGQALFDIKDPQILISRSETYFLTPNKDYEIVGQVGNVCFLEGLVRKEGKWFLYYGTADSKIAVASGPISN